FNINFDSLEDDVFEINKLGLFETSDLHTNSSSLLLEDKCKTSPFLFSDLANFKNTITTTSDTINDAPTATTTTTKTTVAKTAIVKPSTPKPTTPTPKSPSIPKKQPKLR